MDALISNAGAAIKAMVLTTDDSLEDILAETVAAAEQALREMKGEAAPPPPPPLPTPSLKPWCGACELTGDGLRVAAGCAVANGSVAFYDADQASSTPVLSVACDAVAASYALGTDGVTFRADELTYTVRFEDPGDVAGFCRAVASTARATRIFELRASADERVVLREDLCEVSIKAYRGDALVLEDPDAACAADGSIEPVPGLGARAASFFTLDGVFHDVQLHAIDATSARWRGGARPSPVDSVS